MAQIFHPSSNTIAKASIVAVAFIVGGLGYILYAVNQSAYYTDIKVARQQPVPFSHKHHVTDDGIDCRYCHASVEKSTYAGPRARFVRFLAIPDSSCAATASGSLSTSGMPWSPPSRSRMSMGTRPSTGTGAPTIRVSASATA